MTILLPHSLNYPILLYIILSTGMGDNDLEEKSAEMGNGMEIMPPHDQMQFIIQLTYL